MYRVITIVTLIVTLATLWTVGSSHIFTITPSPVSIDMTEEAKGDQFFNAGNYKDAVKQYSLALKQLGINVEWFSDIREGVTFSYPKQPLRAAIVMRKWARAIQFFGDAQYAATGKLPLMTLEQALAASSTSTNL
ncbi:hypothetical protein KA005_54470, partial [bacterium]|nr:hypothetical protein [bacterium]